MRTDNGRILRHALVQRIRMSQCRPLSYQEERYGSMGEDTMTDESVTTPLQPASPWRLWVPGRVINGAVVLPIVSQDTPSPPETAWGRLCMVKACRKRDPHATRSLRFQPSGICVACWER
jgi:hypothetical protein